VGDGSAFHWNLNQVLLGIVATLTNAIRYFPGLTDTRSDIALTIANYDNGTKAKAATTLNHFRYAVDLDHALFQII
jgi:hypothetical protein